MVIAILIPVLAALIEIGFGIYCLITKSNQKKIRSFIRMGAFTLFALFTLVSIIQWSFRWMLLAGVLFIWAIIGGISLLRKKPDVKKLGLVRFILKGLAMWLIVFIAVSPAIVFPQYKMPKVTGKYKVKTVNYTYRDVNRVDPFSSKGAKRKVSVEFWYPKNTGSRYPLVVFSHGAIGTKSTNESTFRELASNGYIVCSISHTSHSLVTVDTNRKITLVNQSFLNEVMDVDNDKYDEQTEYKLQQKWMKVRTEDMNFVLDTIIRNANDSRTGKVYQLIDPHKIGLIGHSLGGAASVQVGRERSDVQAVVNLDADLLGEYVGYENGKYELNHKAYPVPLLSIYSDDMKRLFDKITDPEVMTPQKLIAETAPKAFEVYFKGTNHFSLTDLPLSSPLLVSWMRGSIKDKIGGQKADKYYVIEKMNSLVLEFYNCYLKGGGDFRSAGTY